MYPDVATPKSKLFGYLSLARFDHITKHVFIVPGIVLCLLIREADLSGFETTLVLGFLSAIAIASANYVINEWLDREFDAHHPVKSQRSSVQLALSPAIVYAQYALLAIVGLSLAYAVNNLFFFGAVLFLAQGIVYNVEPFRTKDRFVLDVLSESVNNPIRLLLGWAMVDPTSLPPSSLVLSYWLGGAFLMNSKRLSEYRDLVRSVGKDRLVLYRRSFKEYSANRLLVACMLYALLSGFFMAVFFVKFRIEYVLLLPVLALLFSIYFGLSLKKDSVAQAPEKLFRSRLIIGCVAVLAVGFAVLSYVDLPLLDTLTAQHFIELPLSLQR